MFQGFIRFPEFAKFTEFNESSAPFRKNSNDINTRKKTYTAINKTRVHFSHMPTGHIPTCPSWCCLSEQVWTCLGVWGRLNGRRFPGEQVLTEPDSGHMSTPLENRQTRLTPLPSRIPLRAIKTPQCFTVLKLEFIRICTFHVRSLQHDAFVTYPYSTKINLHFTFE